MIGIVAVLRALCIRDRSVFIFSDNSLLGNPFIVIVLFRCCCYAAVGIDLSGRTAGLLSRIGIGIIGNCCLTEVGGVRRRYQVAVLVIGIAALGSGHDFAVRILYFLGLCGQLLCAVVIIAGVCFSLQIAVCIRLDNLCGGLISIAVVAVFRLGLSEGNTVVVICDTVH